MDVNAMIRPVPKHAVFDLDDWLVWGASMVRTADGLCHLYASRWPQSTGHNGWVTHSEIVHAVSWEPLGPYTLEGAALPARRGQFWDGDVTHNPTILQWKDRFYLYYTGNRGNGDYWVHRNHQRIGVAVAERPEGPWQRFDEPLLDVSPDSWDSLIATNPSCTSTPGGRFLLMYKAAGSKLPGPRHGPVRHGVAFADHPLGPFIKHSEPIFASADAVFPGEDPYVWCQGDTFYAILKDMGQFYTQEERALVLFESPDGITWTRSSHPVVTTRRIAFEGCGEKMIHRLERPQVYFENGKPTVLFCAALWEQDADASANIHIPLG